MIEGISAITLATHEMPRAVQFYRALGFEVLHGSVDRRELISKFEETSKMLMQTDVGPLAHASVDAVLAHLRSIATEPKLVCPLKSGPP